MTYTVDKQIKRNTYYDEALAEGVLLRMMLIPRGSFMMGSPENELERTKAEGPQHRVRVPQFFMGKYPVTQSQWRAVADMPQVKQELKKNPSRFKGDNRPVEQVSWYDAEEFCARLSQSTQRPYRLPSEAEWEYACRAGTTTPFHFGETLDTDYANYNGSSEKYGAYGPGKHGEYRRETTPIDTFGCANNYGLCDMHGNVREWCQDYWHKDYVGAPENGSPWVTGGDKNGRVRRGGSWVSNPWLCRSAYRNYNSPEFRNDYIGFRVSCSAPRALA
ncbi:MAG: formylglycine-generating enzyme family protein [Cyanobacteria bacterium P01_F01_bin.86]